VFEPDCVTVKGPVKLIEQLDSASLGAIELKDLNINTVVERQFPADSSSHLLEFSPAIVKVSIPVEKYTESEMESFVQILNNQSYKIKTFPDKVKVFFKVALKDFEKIEPGMITVAADFGNVDISRDDRVKIMVENHPDFIVITKIEPEKAEFIIIK
jgi:YbbR domain-containing protein